MHLGYIVIVKFGHVNRSIPHSARNLYARRVYLHHALTEIIKRPCGSFAPHLILLAVCYRIGPYLVNIFAEVGSHALPVFGGGLFVLEDGFLESHIPAYQSRDFRR